MRITVDEAQIDVEIAGTGDAIVLIHGFPFNRDLWRSQVAALANHALVIAPDLRGMGRSSVPQGPYLMETLAADIAAVLDAIGVPQSAIVGHSLGGYVAMAFCRMYTERVNRLALVCSRLNADTSQAAKNREALADRAEQDGVDVVIDAYLPQLFADVTHERNPEIIRYASEIARNNDRFGLASMLRGMAQRIDASDIAADLNMPVLIVAGGADRIVPISETQAMAAAFPDSRLEVIPECGHTPMLEQPAALTALLSNFIGASGGTERVGERYDGT